MRKRIVAFLLFLCLLPFSSFSQGVLDHLNNDVFYTVNSKCSFNFTSNLVGVTGAYFYDTSEYVYSDEKEGHVAHANAFVLNFNLIDFNSNLNDFFTQSNQPTLSINFGHSFNSVTNFNNWDELNAGERGFLGAVDRDLYVGVFVSKSFYNYWDSVNRQFTDQTIENYNGNSFRNFDKFFSYGFKVDYNLYYARWIALAFTATVQNGFMKPLANFQNMPTAYNAANNVYAMNDIAGKVGGNLNERLSDMRFSIGVPLFIRSMYQSVRYTESKNKEFANKNNFQKTFRQFWGSLFVMPYFAPDGWVNNRWNNEVGASLNLLQTPFGGSNSKIVATEGLGVDWQTGMNTRNGWSGPIVYITGKLNIGSSPDRGRQKHAARQKDMMMPETPEHDGDAKEDK